MLGNWFCGKALYFSNYSPDEWMNHTYLILTPPYLISFFLVAYSSLGEIQYALLVRAYSLFFIVSLLLYMSYTETNLTQVIRLRYLFNDASQRANSNLI